MSGKNVLGRALDPGDGPPRLAVPVALQAADKRTAMEALARVTRRYQLPPAALPPHMAAALAEWRRAN